MNNQEVFDKAATHMLKQGRHSALKYQSNVGAYRGEGGLMCGIGALLPDEVYHPDMEKLNVLALIDNYPQVKELFADVNPLLLDNIQDCHDHFSPLSWKTKFYKMAELYKLNNEVLLSFEKTSEE